MGASAVDFPNLTIDKQVSRAVLDLRPKRLDFLLKKHCKEVRALIRKNAHDYLSSVLIKTNIASIDDVITFVDILLKNGANLNVTSTNGTKDIAIFYGIMGISIAPNEAVKIKLWRFLLKKGPDKLKSSRNTRGNTPLKMLEILDKRFYPRAERMLLEAEEVRQKQLYSGMFNRVFSIFDSKKSSTSDRKRVNPLTEKLLPRPGQVHEKTD